MLKSEIMKSNIKLIQINPHTTKKEEYAAITANARIKIKARKRIGTRDDDRTAIIEEWWVETDLLAYLPAWDLEDIQKGRDYAVIIPQPDFYPSWWYQPWEWQKNQRQLLTRARSSMDIHPNDYQQLKASCHKIREQIAKEFLISRNGLAWGWKDFKII
ncbi:MAG: hypothetical protein V7L03_17675 [Nostoc sp.]